MKRNLLFLTFIIFSLGINAKVVLSDIFSNDMILQRKTDFQIWGMADKNSDVIIKASWLKAPVYTRADDDGCWCATIITSDIKYAPQTLTIIDRDSKVVLENITIGDKWICYE